MKLTKSILTGVYAMLEFALTGSSKTLNDANKAEMRSPKKWQSKKSYTSCS